MKLRSSGIKDWVLAVLLVSVAWTLFAQQGAVSSLYMLDKYRFNPAYAGLDASLSINGSYRTQWNGIEGNPVQQHLDAHLPLYILNGGTGISFDSESIGAEKTLVVRGSYNYVLQSQVGLFSIGGSAGYLQKTLDGRLLRAPDGDYEGSLIIHNDANLPEGLTRGGTGEFALGAWFAGEFLEVGVGVSNVLLSEIQLEGATYKGTPVYHLYGEYLLPLTSEVNLYPSLFVQSDLRQTQTEISVRAQYRGFLMLGTSLRGYSQNTFDSVNFFLGIKISEHIGIGYAYDITISSLARVSSGSHEILVRYNLNKTIGAVLPPPVIYNPRYY